MDRETLVDQLVALEMQIAEGSLRIDRQRKIVERRWRLLITDRLHDRQDATTAQKALLQLEQEQSALLDHRARLLKQFELMPKLGPIQVTAQDAERSAPHDLPKKQRQGH